MAFVTPPPPFFFGFGGSGTVFSYPFISLSIAGPGGARDTADTVNLDGLSIPGSLTVSAGTINFGGPVTASSVSLTSVNSLTFPSTGVPYLGSVTVNDAPPSGQPFAGDPYITGPDWGSYGYAPGDKINILNATNSNGTLSSGPYTVAPGGIIGDNLYLDDPTNIIGTFNGTNLTGNFTNVTVRISPSSFTPEIQASSVTLDVTGAGSTISGAVSGAAAVAGSLSYVFLNATTAGGNITIQDLPPTNTNLYLGTLNAGTGTIQLDVNGSVESAAFLNSWFSEYSWLFPFNPFSGDANVVNLTASAVDLTTTGSSSAIGSTGFPITTQSGDPGQSLKLTAATNDGGVYIQDSSPAGLTINSIVADQKGQAPVVNNGQVVYSTPGSSTPNTSGNDDVVINAPTATYAPTGEPVVVNSVSATGNVTIYGEYILEGNAQSPNIIARSVDLVALGIAEYQGQVTFAQASTGDTLTLPAGELWSDQFLFDVSDNTIVVSGALASADDGVFTIASVSGSTLTLTQSYVLTPEQDIVTVGDGMIGLASAPISLSDVPLFNAVTKNGDIYLQSGMDSTAQNVSAGGGPYNMANDVSVTSQANFLVVEGIFATGDAAVTMNSGALVEYNSGIITGQSVSLTSPYNIGTASLPLQIDATGGLSVDATATSPSSAGIYIDNTATSALTAVGVSTYDGSVTILSEGSEPPLLSFDNSDSVLSETGTAVVTFANTDGADGSAGNVVVSGTVYVSSISAGISADGTAGAGQILTNPTTSGVITGIGGNKSMIMLLAGSGIGTLVTPLEISSVAIVDASTNTGGIYINGPPSARSPLTLSASTSAGDIDVNWNGDIDLGSELSSTAGVVLPSISAPGTVTLDAVGGAIADENDSTVSANTLFLTAAKGGIGTASSPLETSSPGTLTLTAAAGDGLFLDSSTALTVASATAKKGDLSISAAGNLTLLGQVDDPLGNVTLTATAGALTTGNITTSATAITTTGQQTVTPAIMEPYITVGAALLINAGQADQETVTVTAVTATTFTATFANTHLANFAISTAPISARSLTITAEQIGSPSDVIQTIARTINATANYGGIYLSNDTLGILKLTAAAVGTDSKGVAPNNITIYSAGDIFLLQQTTALTQLATSLPVAVFTPGGVLKLFAGYTLSADGNTPTTVNSSATIISTTTPPTASCTVDADGEVNPTVSFSPGSAGLNTAPYTTAPTVTFSGGGGSGAAATATINANGQLTGITITNGGKGYTSAPTVTISPPGDDIYTGRYDINGTTDVTSQSPPPPPYLLSLVIVSNTAEVVVSPPGTTGIPALITLADLTTLAAQTNGTGIVPVAYGTETVATTNGTTTVTIMADAITIDDLGQDGSAGTAVIPDGWSLVLDATDGPVVFLNLGDTIATTGTGTITVAAGPSTVDAGASANDVAALGNLTTGGGAITVSAGGNIGVGTLTAGTGAPGTTVSVTSVLGAILFSTASTPTTPNVTAGSTALMQHTQRVPSTQSVALAELKATQVIAAADAAYAQAVAAADAAGAQAAAELASANAFQAALTSIQAAVTTDKQTYQAAKQIADKEQGTVQAEQNKVVSELTTVTNLDIAAGSFDLIAAVLTEVTAIAEAVTAPAIQVPVVGTAASIAIATLNGFAATAGLVAAVLSVGALGEQVKLNDDSNALANDVGTLASDQANEQGAYAQLQADMDTETALAAAYDVAKQAYTSSEQAYTNDQTTSAQVQTQGDTNQAIAIAGVVFAAPPQPINSTGSVNITGHSPLTVSDTTAVAAINLTAAPDDPTTETDNLTVNSGVTVQSTGSSVSLVAGNNVDIESGSTIEAATAIAVTANGNDDPSGATVTVAGTLSATSASIGVDSGATGNETFNITPSATTPISVDGGSDSGGANTLNFNADGLPVTISGDTITAGTLAPVRFSNIQVVNITNGSGLTVEASGAANIVGTGPEAGTATLNGVAFNFSGISQVTVTSQDFQNVEFLPNLTISAGGFYSGKAVSARALVNGAASLDGITPTLTYYRGSTVGPANKLSGPPISLGTYTVVAAFAGDATYVSASASRTFTIAPGTPQVSVNPVKLTYGTALANSQLSGTATFIVNGTKVSVPGTYSYTNAAGTVLAASASAYTEQVTFTPTDTTDDVTQTDLSVLVTVAKATPNVTVNPVNLTYGTALANSQLSGTATFIANGTKVSVPGTYSYTSTSTVGTILKASSRPYSEKVTFTPTDTTDYVTQTNLSVTVNVGKATPNVTVNPVNLTYGTALANSQLSGTATFIVNGTKVSVPGTYRYTSKAGKVLPASASAYTEQVTFKPTDTTDYVTLTDLSVTVNVGMATPKVRIPR
jgi:hypothetical protein